VGKVVLTQRGLLTGDSESFRPVLWTADVTPAFPNGPRSLSLEPGNAARATRQLETLCGGRVAKKPRELSLSGCSVNRKDAGIRVFKFGSSG
jgi:hypothetical protein